jgi:hypothetical protein
MWELFWNLMIFFGGMAVGQIRATNNNIVDRNNHMQDLVDQAYEKRDLMKQQWLDAEEKAETWKRRYESLIPIDKD